MPRISDAKFRAQIPTVLLIGGDQDLLERCQAAAMEAGIVVKACPVSMAAALAEERRPVAIVITHAVYALDPVRFETLARDAISTLVRVDSTLSEDALGAMLATAVRESRKQRTWHGAPGRYSVVPADEGGQAPRSERWGEPAPASRRSAEMAAAPRSERLGGERGGADWGARRWDAPASRPGPAYARRDSQTSAPAYTRAEPPASGPAYARRDSQGGVAAVRPDSAASKPAYARRDSHGSGTPGLAAPPRRETPSPGSSSAVVSTRSPASVPGSSSTAVSAWSPASAPGSSSAVAPARSPASAPGSSSAAASARSPASAPGSSSGVASVRCPTPAPGSTSAVISTRHAEPPLDAPEDTRHQAPPSSHRAPPSSRRAQFHVDIEMLFDERGMPRADPQVK